HRRGRPDHRPGGGGAAGVGDAGVRPLRDPALELVDRRRRLRGPAAVPAPTDVAAVPPGVTRTKNQGKRTKGKGRRETHMIAHRAPALRAVLSFFLGSFSLVLCPSPARAFEDVIDSPMYRLPEPPASRSLRLFPEG